MDMKSLSFARLELFNLNYKPITTLEQLHIFLQNAVTLEFATIPPYTTAMFSMQDKSCDAYHMTASVAMEEMLHAYQAANLLIAVGGIPRFVGEQYTPKYPTFIPRADKETTPLISLSRATVDLYKNVFMGIETPASFASPPEDEKIQTIGQFYKAIEDGIVHLEQAVQKKGETIFRDTEGYEQHQDYYFGRGGGYIIKVSDLASAKQAIKQIVQQGEGAVAPGETLVPDESWGAYNQYGKRVDGDYGPIIGDPIELSHYFKFKEIADQNLPLPDTYPIVTVPDINQYQNTKAKQLANAFNAAYSELLRCLEESFKTGAEGRDAYFKKTVKLMHHQLPHLANLLMQTSIWSDGDSTVGPNASPSWEYTDATIADALVELEAIYREEKARDFPVHPRIKALNSICASMKEIENPDSVSV